MSRPIVRHKIIMPDHR